MIPLLVLSLLAAAQEAEAPRETTPLFNGKDLSGFTTWLQASATEDPKKVFTVHDGMIHASGDGMGYVATAKPWRDYRLTLEYKWGTRTDGGKYVRNSGVLVHAGRDGEAGKGAWAPSIEVQLAQGCEGDLIGIRGKDPLTMTVETVLGPDRRPRWKRGGTPTVYSGKQFWWSNHDPDFKELLDTRGKNDVASPLGEWTRVEVVADGKRLAVSVNGVQVNEATEVSPSSGRILLQCEGHEVFFRKVDIHPLPEKKR